MIGTVYLRVAVQAVLAQHLLRARRRVGTRQAGAAVGRARVELRQMALLTQPGPAIDQKVVVYRAVRLVGDRAIIATRIMLPKERDELFGLAGVKGLVGRRRDH